MARLWLACCGREDLVQVAQEIEARTPNAQILRFSGVGHPALASETLPNRALGAVIAARGASGEAVEKTVTEIARSGCAPEIVVIADRLDPGMVARFFFAGATEVIAADDAGIDTAEHAGEARVEGSSRAEQHGQRPVRCDDRAGEGKRYRTWVDQGRDGSLEEERPVRAAEIDRSDPDRKADPEAGRCPADSPVPRDSATVSVSSPVSWDPESASAASLNDASQRQPSACPAPASDTPRAPVVTALSGRGGSGKTTLICAMACCAARAGLRAAVIDLDLMFGDAHRLLGVDEPRDLMRICSAGEGVIADADIEATAMRIAPGLTLWGPIERPELAEMMGEPCERLIAVLRSLSDVVFIDTSVFWGDAAAAAAAAADRCLIVGSAGPSSCSSASRLVDLAGRLGVPRTKMASVLMRYGAPSCGEDAAMRFEMATSLKSRARISDGGSEVFELASYGRMHELMAGESEFARSVRSFTVKTLRELGCEVHGGDGGGQGRIEARPRIRLPWRNKGGEGA